MSDAAQQLMGKINGLTQQQPKNTSQIQEYLNQLKTTIRDLENDVDYYEMYQYFKYFIAEVSLNYLNLNEKEKKMYECQLNQYKIAYEEQKKKQEEQIQDQKEKNQYEEEQKREISEGDQFIQQMEFKGVEIEMQPNQEKLKDLNQKFLPNFGQKRLQETNKVFLILGNTGVGKSSFIKKISGTKKTEDSNGEDSHTKSCISIQYNGLMFIDTPGIDDTQKNRFQILLDIAKYLQSPPNTENNFQRDLLVENIFILFLHNQPLKIQQNGIQQFVFSYFMYELFQDKISHNQVEYLFQEYIDSQGLLNWIEGGYQLKHDELKVQREELFKNREKLKHYSQQFNSFHISVTTFFDIDIIEKKQKKVDVIKMDFLKEQKWSNKIERLTDDFKAYKDHLEKQEDKLYQKIQRICRIENAIQTWRGYLNTQYIILIGKSQVGKSSLIEQLTGLYGIRGSGEQSMTNYCQMYPVAFENQKYIIIDTPGYEGTEKITPFQNLKVIAEFLRINKIKEFKLLLMRNKDKDLRDTVNTIMKYLIIFIQSMLDQDSSFEDSEYLSQLFLLNQHEVGIPDSQQIEQDLFLQYYIKSIKEKTLQVLRTTERINQSYQFQGIDSVDFQSNTCDLGQYEYVEQDENNKQIKTLFQGIQKKDSICIDDKILFRIKQISQIIIIDKESKFKEAFQSVRKLYIDLDEIQQKIQSHKPDKGDYKLKELKKQKLKILEEKSNKLYAVVGDIYQISIIEDCLNHNNNHNQQQNNQQQTNKLFNNIQKHFLPIKFTSILFEADSNSANVFLSRKQFYFHLYFHLLKRFIDPKSKKHQELLQELAKIKIIQELALLQLIQQKQLESEYCRDIKQTIGWMSIISKGIATIIGAGGQIYRYSTYFSMLQEATNVVKDSGLFKFLGTINIITSALSIGVDIFYYTKKGYISQREVIMNSVFNLISLSASIYCIFYLGSGLLYGNAGVFSLAGYAISAQIFTSKSTFDETIRIFFKNIIEDAKPNQFLLYFQQSELLKKYSIINYSQLADKQGYEMYRKLEEKKYHIPDQQQILKRLFNNNGTNEQLINQVSQFLVQNIQCHHFFQEFQELKKEQNLENYLQSILSQVKQNQIIISTFYKSFDQEEKINLIKNVEEQNNKVQDFISNKLKGFNQENKNSTENEDLNNTVVDYDILKDYFRHLTEFLNKIKQTNYSYQQYKNFANHYFRKGDRFDILLNSYCNLIQQKTQQLYTQPLISELSKGDQQEQDFLFKVNTSYTYINNKFLSSQSEKQFVDQLNLLTISDQYSTSRYLQKLKGQSQPNLTYLSKSENISGKVEYSHDLHDIAQKSTGKDNFINEVKKIYQCEQELNQDNLKRLENFYNAFKKLQEIFKQNEEI